MTDLSTKYMGLTLENPLIVSSSGLTKTVDTMKACEDAGAGAVVVKSIFEEQIQMEINNITVGSQESLWHPEAAEYIYQYASENAVEQYISTIREAVKIVSIPVIASVHCVSAGNWTSFAKKLESAGASAIELNLFILPSDPRLNSTQIEKIYFDVVKEVKRYVSIPLSLKIGCYFSSLTSTLIELSNSGLDGLVLFNKFAAPDFDIENIKVVQSSTMSNPGEYIQALRWISILSPKINCDLCASTGIHDGEAAIKQILAGASAVQLCSTLYQNGLTKIEKIKKDLSAWMNRHDFKDIESFKGLLNMNNVNNPAQFERVQFMKLSVTV